jgi:hypothetical protein
VCYVSWGALYGIDSLYRDSGQESHGGIMDILIAVLAVIGWAVAISMLATWMENCWFDSLPDCDAKQIIATIHVGEISFK